MAHLRDFSWILLSVSVIIGCAPRDASQRTQIARETYSENRCGGALASWQSFRASYGDLTSINVIRFASGTTYWNDKAVSDAEFGRLIDAIATMPQMGPNYELQIGPTTDCRKVAAARAALNNAIDCSWRCRELSDEDRAVFEARLPPTPSRR
jgi:hypothetical protein